MRQIYRPARLYPAVKEEGLDCPASVLEDLDFLAVFRRCDDVERFVADHEIDMGGRLVEGIGIDFLLRELFVILDEHREGAAEGKMAGGVLVIERGEEETSGLVDGGIHGDQGAFAKIAAVLAVEDGVLEDFLALLGMDFDDLAFMEADREVIHDFPA